MIDTSCLIDTPEGVHLQVSPAGPVPRVLAFGFDFMIRALVFIVFAIVVQYLGDFGSGLSLLFIFLLEWLYPVLFEVLANGATPGKRRYGLRVVHDSGVPVSWSGSLVRNLLRAVDFLPFAYGFGLTSMLLNGQFKRLGDLAAGTLVIYEPPAERVVKIPDVPPARPGWSLSPEDQIALLAFAERTDVMNEERAMEIASVLEPMGEMNIVRLRRYAAWIQGER